MGLLYEPAARQPAGGDVYGAWELPGGGLALLVGDVAGKGVETAALSAMARFFIEARSWDSESPAETLRQANMLLHERLPSDTFVTAFLGLLTRAGLRYANAGHVPPLLLRRRRALGEAPGRGLPLGIESGHRVRGHARSRSAPRRRCCWPTPTGWWRRAATGEMFGAAAPARRPAAEAADGRRWRSSWPRSIERPGRFSGGLQDDAVAAGALRRPLIH